MNDRNKNFLNSHEWIKIRADLALLCGGKCQLCKKPVGIKFHVHHLTYDRYGGNEEPDDLLLLCPRCHAIEHGKVKVKKDKPRNKKIKRPKPTKQELQKRIDYRNKRLLDRLKKEAESKVVDWDI